MAAVHPYMKHRQPSSPAYSLPQSSSDKRYTMWMGQWSLPDSLWNVGVSNHIYVADQMPLENEQCRWIHSACALWTPEVMIRDPKSPADLDLRRLSTRAVRLTCMFCKQAMH